ncbi:MAG: EamA family transporter [Chitinophagaceae bacterium]|nr:EamA family transporter [Chitinophagaceae bacterium]
MWVFYALLSALFAALTALFAKLGVADISSNLATGIRTIVIFLVVWGIVLVKGEMKGITAISKYSMLFLILSGLATGLSWLFYFKALQSGALSKVAVIDKLSVAITILLSVLVLKESLTLNTLLGAGLIIAGTIVLIAK